jgi:tRNA dimethylallyltransferase
MNDKSMNRRVIAVAGPTAAGKTEFAIEIAKKERGEVVSCDSMQLYKYMDIGSAKPSGTAMSEVRHHLYSIEDPSVNMTVADYRKLAIEAIDDILARGKTPIVCGGTGLYLNAILYDMDFGAAPDDEERRQELEELAAQRGTEYMHEYLQGLDPEAASRIHPNNTRKIIRAIEAYEQGKGIKDLSECEINPDYDFRFYALTMKREWLYDRINRRVSRLFDQGLVNEVSDLLNRGYTEDLPAMKAIGYKEVIGFLKGEYDIYDAKELIMKNTRHFAKRQYTWLKRYDFVTWIDIHKGETVGDVVDRILSAAEGQAEDKE